MLKATLWLLPALLLACNRPPAAVSVPEAEARCATLLADPRAPTSPAAAEAARAAGQTWTDGDVRWLYVCRARAIGPNNQTWIVAQQPAEQRAHQAFEARKVAKQTARAMMADASEVAGLRARDVEKYGSPDGPTFAWLVEKAQARGLKGDAVFEDIIAGAQRTNEGVNGALGIPKDW